MAPFIESLAKRRRSAGQVLTEFPKPVVAAVNDYAVGIGCIVMYCCDLIIASDRPNGCRRSRWGSCRNHGGIVRLARWVGKGQAMKIAMDYPITAEEAYRLGLVQRLVPHSELAVQTAAIAERLAGLPPFAARLAKESMNRGLDMPNAADAVYGLVVDRGRQGKPRRLARAPASRYPRRLTGLASVPREVLEFIKEGSNA